MLLQSTLLRVVIGLGVILNGSPFAMAAASLEMHDHSGMQTVAQNAGGAVSAGLPSCHETAAPVGITPNQHAPIAKAAALTKSIHPTADCCKAGRCNCACVHAAATLPSFHWIVAAEIHASIVRHVEAGFPAPILPHLSRPPIA